MSELFSNRVQTTVQTEYLPFAVDTILNSNVFLQRILRGAKKWTHGRKMEVVFKVSTNTTSTSYSGADTFSTATTDNRVRGEYFPKFHQITTALTGDEMAVADTEAAVLNLIKLTMQSDVEDLADSLGTAAYADGTGNGSKDILGLAALVDDGTSVANIAGLSRTTYPTLASTVTSSGGTLTLAKMDTLWNNVTSGTQQPTMIATTEAIFALYGQLLRPQEQIVKYADKMKGELYGTTGFTALDYKGKPVIADEKCTSGVMFFLNENFIDFYALPMPNTKPISYKSQIKGNDYDAPIGLGFTWSDFVIPTNANAFVGHIYFQGQLITTNPKRSGKLTAITGI